MQHFDAVVIGGGMAGVSIGSELARDHKVLVLDMEPTLAYHTTGRSAAMFLESYGGPAVRALTLCSRAFLSDLGALTPLPMLFVAGIGRGSAAEQLYESVRDLTPTVRLLDGDEAQALQPFLRAGAIDAALLEADASEIDVHAVHQFYVHALRERGGTIRTTSRVTEAHRVADGWSMTAGDTVVEAPVVVNAAGAWADELGAVFGARRIGLRPFRRSVFITDAPPDLGAAMVADLDDRYYVKPERGRLLCSPSEQTLQQPSDIKADELEIARAIDAINEATTLGIRHVRSTWAGLRSFVPDGAPVVGFDPECTGLFWFAGQGGYGIQMAPALARAAAALVRGEHLPDDVVAVGLTESAVSPNRLSGTEDADPHSPGRGSATRP